MNYENTIIYKLCCKDANITDIYIGHTISYYARRNNHKKCCNNQFGDKYNNYKYKFIRQNGGWDNWSMIEIKRVNCLDKREAERIERETIDELKPSLNKYMPFTTKDEKINCVICKCLTTRGNIRRHENSKEHQQNINKNVEP